MLSSVNGTLVYEAQITTPTGKTIITNQCTLNVDYLGTASIQINSSSGTVITNNDNSSTYSLISNTKYQIVTYQNAPITLTGANNTTIPSSDIYYQ
ncbi:hypothetical protein IKS57_04060 [bacterium]|nr:hypothetical protein [bacterium]